jgi:hypothetical protein
METTHSSDTGWITALLGTLALTYVGVIWVALSYLY